MQIFTKSVHETLTIQHMSITKCITLLLMNMTEHGIVL